MTSRWFVIAVILIIFVVTAAIIWENVLEDMFIPRRWGGVEEGKIYRSGVLHPYMVEHMLTENNIKAIANLTCPAPYKEQEKKEREVAKKLGIDLKFFPLGGSGKGDPMSYVGAVAMIVKSERAGKPVWVHCSAGTHRTGGVIAVYRVLVQKKSPEEAFEEMVRYDFKRRDKKKLIPWINQHMLFFAEELKKAGALSEIPNPLPVLKPN